MGWVERCCAPVNWRTGCRQWQEHNIAQLPTACLLPCRTPGDTSAGFSGIWFRKCHDLLETSLISRIKSLSYSSFLQVMSTVSFLVSNCKRWHLLRISDVLGTAFRVLPTLVLTQPCRKVVSALPRGGHGPWGQQSPAQGCPAKSVRPPLLSPALALPVCSWSARWLPVH